MPGVLGTAEPTSQREHIGYDRHHSSHDEVEPEAYLFHGWGRFEVVRSYGSVAGDLEAVDRTIGRPGVSRVHLENIE